MNKLLAALAALVASCSHTGPVMAAEATMADGLPRLLYAIVFGLPAIAVICVAVGLLEQRLRRRKN